MTESTTYRGNKLQVKKQDGEKRLLVNGKKLRCDLDSSGLYASAHSYTRYSDLIDLGRAIVDQQMSLSTPTLEGLVRERGEG